MVIIKGIVLLLCLWAGPTLSWAHEEEIDLTKEHGKDLEKAAFVVRQKFYYDHKKDWAQSTHGEREEFLKQWHAKSEQDKALDEAEIQARFEADKEAKKQQKILEHDKKVKEKAELKALKDEEKAKRKQAKDFERKVKKQKDTIRDLKRKQKASRRAL